MWYDFGQICVIIHWLKRNEKDSFSQTTAEKQWFEGRKE